MVTSISPWVLPSVGLETVEDLLRDLDQALVAAG
jgi:cystathionine beta-lyase/cystathionine gamma-synthase